jgi:hypothetical protein
MREKHKYKNQSVHAATERKHERRTSRVSHRRTAIARLVLVMCTLQLVETNRVHRSIMIVYTSRTTKNLHVIYDESESYTCRQLQMRVVAQQRRTMSNLDGICRWRIDRDTIKYSTVE